jgi:hypothetical protein
MKSIPKFVSDCSAAAVLKFSNWLKKCANYGGLRKALTSEACSENRG